MRNSTRLFEIIQILRGARRPITAQALAQKLEVSARTVYRDIAALQARRTPIEGEAGIGYIMRAGYDLPPLNFDSEEIEALRVGLSMLLRSGDTSLVEAGKRVRDKIDALHAPADWIHVAPWGAPLDVAAKGCVSVADLRLAMREERKLRLRYQDGEGNESIRQVRPLAVIYHLECNMLAAWCELRAGFRHFRLDRIIECTALDDHFTGQGQTLRALWQEGYQWDKDAEKRTGG
jgi:predicted DNA-binding transcriptional regulator YafY